MDAGELDRLISRPEGDEPRSDPLTTLVGGVGQLYQGDLDLGRRAADRLGQEDLGERVRVEELTYGAVAVAQRLEEARPGTLILVGAEARGDPPATVRRRRLDEADVDMATAQGAVADAITGYVAIDLVVDVAAALGALPPRTVSIEVEPAATEPSEHLTPAAEEALERALHLVRAEVRRVALLDLADEVRDTVDDPSTWGGAGHGQPPEALRGLLEGLRTLDRHGRWANTFAERDRLRAGISSGGLGDGMDERDRLLLWSLIEELDRLQAIEAVHRLEP